MSAQNLTDFGLSYLYFNVHSTAASTFCAPAANCGAGEIRGNIAVQ